ADGLRPRVAKRAGRLTAAAPAKGSPNPARRGRPPTRKGLAALGGAAARLGARPPTPQELLDDDPEELRAAAGLSRAKVSYLRSLAEHVLSGELELERLDELGDEAVIAELVAVKGLGLWTAQMFLMFHLERPDVLPVGDLGIRRAIERAYDL